MEIVLEGLVPGITKQNSSTKCIRLAGCVQESYVEHAEYSPEKQEAKIFGSASVLTTFERLFQNFWSIDQMHFGCIPNAFFHVNFHVNGPVYPKIQLELYSVKRNTDQRSRERYCVRQHGDNQKYEHVGAPVRTRQTPIVVRKQWRILNDCHDQSTLSAHKPRSDELQTIADKLSFRETLCVAI